jgi:hypothetical protein
MNFSKLMGSEKNKKSGRIPCSWSIRFYELGRGQQTRHAFYTAKCKSVDPNGLEITSIIPLTPKRFVLIKLDLNALETVVPTKDILTLSGKCVLTEVAWRHLNLKTGLFEAGLDFIEASRTEEFEPVFKQIPEQFF